jgi:eukaryotic-like serine/threonine-protein kinase
MVPSASTAELLHAVLALQLGLISLEEAQEALDACASGGGKNVGEALVEAQRLSQTQDELVAKLVEAFLNANQGDAERSLALLEETPAGQVLSDFSSRRNDATVAFDGSKTSPRRAPTDADRELRITSSGERFRKLKLHAAGGLGEVSLARDEQLRRDVALKQLQEQYADDLAKRERFVLEGEVTGALEHPGIVPVYAMGVDALGRPFYAMRFVRGESFRHAALRWHDGFPRRARRHRQSLELRRLLGRFMSVCQAIDYAHSRGVIHRDIKPANIMLGKYGETYVVDWGMARVVGKPSLDPSPDGEEMVQASQLSGSSETRFGSVFGTPAYMSPEQAAGRQDEVGPCSDIYSLGATLYFLLTGRAPFASERKNPLSLIREVEQGDFPRPSSLAATPRELEAVCLCAMARKPDQRYASAAAMAADIERWLADEPVAACRPTTLERVTRWGRKHRNAVLAGGAALLLVSIVSAAAALAVNRARLNEKRTAERNLQLAIAADAARDEADRRFLHARETVDAWLTGYSEALQPLPGLQPVRARMLELAAREYEAFVKEKADRPAVQLERGRTLIRLGSVYRLLGRNEDALSRYTEAQNALRLLAANNDVGKEAQVALGLAFGLAGLAHAELGDVSSAEASFQSGVEAVGPAEAAAGEGDDELRAALVTLWTNRGGVRAAAGRLAEADEAFAKALAIGESLAGAHSGNLVYGAALAAAKLGASQVRLAQGDAVLAGKLSGEAVDFYAAAAEIDKQNADYPRLLAQAGLYLASARRRMGDVVGEQQAYVHAIGGARALAEAQPEVPAYRADLALGQIEYAQLLIDQFNASMAEPLIAEAIATLEGLVAEYPAIAGYREALASASDNRARALLALGRHADALVSAEQATLELKALSETWPNVTSYQERLAVAESTAAQALLAAADAVKAIERFSSAVQRLEALSAHEEANAGRRHIEAMLRTRYGEALAPKDRVAASEQFAKARAAWDALLADSDDPEFANGAAWFMITCPEPPDADFAKAVELSTRAVAAAPANIRYRLTCGLALALAGRADDSLKRIRSDEIEKNVAAPTLKYVEAIALQAAGSEAEAQSAWQAAEEWTAKALPGDWDLGILRKLAASRLKAKGS